MKHTSIASGVMAVADIVLDAVNVFVLKGGMFGMALASSASAYLALIFVIPHFFKKRYALKLCRGSLRFADLKEVVTTGAPAGFTSALYTVQSFTLNRMLIYTGGDLALLANSVVGTLSGIFCTTNNALGSTVHTMIGIAADEENIESVRRTRRNSLKYGTIANAVSGLLMIVQSYELMGLKQGYKLFISGGTGSVGAMAIPIAKSLGATVFTNGSADNEERVLSLGVDRFIDYKKEDYADILSDVDCVLDTLGERELAKELTVLKQGGSIVSLRAMPNGEFAKRSDMCAVKQFVFKMAGSKFDKMAAEKGQTYYFIFVHEDGEGLRKVSEIFTEKQIHASVDGVFSLDDVNKALQKIAAGGSKGKTILRIAS